MFLLIVWFTGEISPYAHRNLCAPSSRVKKAQMNVVLQVPEQELDSGCTCFLTVRVFFVVDALVVVIAVKARDSGDVECVRLSADSQRGNRRGPSSLGCAAHELPKAPNARREGVLGRDKTRSIGCLVGS